MAIIPKKVGLGTHLTGSDVKVNKIAVSAANRIIKEAIEDDMMATFAHADSSQQAIRAQYSHFGTVMTPASIVTNKMVKLFGKDKSVREGETHLSRAYFPYMNEWDMQMHTPQQSAILRQQAHMNQVFKSLGMGGLAGYGELDTSITPETSALAAKARAEDAAKARLRANLAASRIARQSSKFDPNYFAKQQEADYASIRAEQAALNRRDAHRAWIRKSFGKASAQEKKDGIDIVAKGTEKAMKKADAMTSSKFTSLASALAIGRVAQRAGGYVLSAAKSATTTGMDVTNAALNAGVDPETLAKWSFAMKRFGGSEADASKMLAMISHLRQKALEGDSDAYLEAAKRYGLDITGSGHGGIGTLDEITERVHKLMSGNQISQMQKWGLAQTLQMSASVRRVMGSGDEELNKFLKDPSIPNAYDFEELDRQEQEWNVAKAKFNNAIIKLAANTNIIEFWSDALSSISSGIIKEANLRNEEEESLAKGVPIIRKPQEVPMTGFGASSGLTGFIMNLLSNAWFEKKVEKAIEVYGTVDIRGPNGEVIGEAPLHSVENTMYSTKD